MNAIFLFLNSWIGQFDTTNLYQLTILRHQYPDQFIPIHYPIHRNTGVHIHDVYINRDNELLLDQLMHSTLPFTLKQSVFMQQYREPPSGVGIRYRHAR